MKKFWLIILSFLFLGASSVFADDFHKYYKQLNANSAKTYNYEDLNRIPIKVRIMSDITTKKNLEEGQRIVFLTTEDTVLSHKKVLKAGSRVFGRVETISKNGMMGIPANLIIGNFKIEYMSTVKPEGTIVKQGANRAIWVKPLAPIFFAVRGGHAKVKTTEVFELYYSPKAI